MKATALVGMLAVCAMCAVSLTGCSLVLDLPADCTPDDCNGYQCNPEGTGCLIDCDGDEDCADGFLCNTGRDACVEIGCEPAGELQVLFPQADDARDVTLLWNGAEMGAVYPGEGGLEFARIDVNGQPLADPVVLDERGASPQRPSLAWTGDVWAISWEATGLIDGVRRELLRFAVVGVGDRFDVAPVTLWNTTEDQATATIEKSVDTPSIAWDAERERFVIVWSTQVDAADVWMLIVDREGKDLGGNDPDEIPHETAQRVNLTGADSVAPIVNVRSAEVYDVVYREGAASVNVLLRTFDRNADRQGGDVNLSATDARIDSHGHVRINTGSVVAFTEVNGERSVSYRAQIKNDRTIAGGTKLPIERDFVSTSDATVAARADGSQYAVVLVGERLERREVYMARFKDNGASIAVPFSLTELQTRAPVHPRVVGTDEGFMVLFQETEGSRQGQILGQHWTCD